MTNWQVIEKRHLKPLFIEETEPITDADIGWTAGIIDGEGCISINKGSPKYGGRYSTRVTVCNTNIAMLEKLKVLWGGAVNIRNTKTERHSESWLWTLSGNDAIRMLFRVKPFLVTKQMQAQVSIAFQMRQLSRSGLVVGQDKNRRSYYTLRMSEGERAIRDGFYLCMRRLNAKGPQKAKQPTTEI